MKKDPKESLPNLQDNRQDPMRWYNILQEFYAIVISSGKTYSIVVVDSIVVDSIVVVVVDSD